MHMNTLLTHSFIAISAGLIGGLSNSLFISEPHNTASINNTYEIPLDPLDNQMDTSEDIQIQVQYLHKKIIRLENKLTELAKHQTDNPSDKKTKKVVINSIDNRNNIISSGINADTADELLHNLDQQSYRRLELQNLIQQGDASQRKEYSKQLLELNKNKISLRSEMGDDAFDQYLFTSGESNRVKVASVMLGSPAESAGILSNDVILYYDNHKILNWTDIRSASINGEIGSYANVQISRDGEEISLSVPRGALGLQFESFQLDPYSGH